jgi:hypothetical protein
VFEEVREAGLLVALVPAAGPNVEADGGRAGMRQFRGDDAETVVQACSFVHRGG